MITSLKASRRLVVKYISSSTSGTDLPFPPAPPKVYIPHNKLTKVLTQCLKCLKLHKLRIFGPDAKLLVEKNSAVNRHHCSRVNCIHSTLPSMGAVWPYEETKYNHRLQNQF